MHIFLNALGASCASGFTYVRNVLPNLSACPGVRTTVAVNRKLRRELPDSERITVHDILVPADAARRFWFEQTRLPGIIRRSGADVLISAGNFALWYSPVPQILLSGNSLYTSSDFSNDLRSRKEYLLLRENRIKSFFARLSIHWADSTVAPSRSFAEDLRKWAAKEVSSIYHGFDQEVFFADRTPLPENIRHRLDSSQDALRLLFVSHYNYYRNFETLLGAIPNLRARLRKKIRLFLTCNLRSDDNPGSYRAERAAALVGRLGIEEEVVQLGAVPYRQLHQLYKQCDIYVSPAYAETFAHPLVEAMACGLPVVTSDLPVHREICGRAALYFQRFSAKELSAQIVRLAESPALCRELSAAARSRSRDFSWAKHVHELVTLAFELSGSCKPLSRSRDSTAASGADVQAVREVG